MVKFNRNCRREEILTGKVSKKGSHFQPYEGILRVFAGHFRLYELFLCFLWGRWIVFFARSIYDKGGTIKPDSLQAAKSRILPLILRIYFMSCENG